MQSFQIDWERQGKHKKQIFVVLKGEEQGQLVFLVAKVLLLFNISSTSAGVIKEFAYHQCMEVTSAVSSVEMELGCVCIKWATGDEMYITYDIAQSIGGNQVEESAYYGLFRFSSIVITVNVLRSNIAIKPFTEDLP